MPVVSVVIPTYKHRDYVLQTLGSVFAQTFTDYEVIVVNDGSPDDTADVLRPLIEAGRIQYIAQANAGQSAARNRGIAAATGAYIALLDDDDLWPPDKLQWQVSALNRHSDASLVYGGVEGFGTPVGEPLCQMDGPSGQAHKAFLEKNWITTPGQTLIRASALRRVGGFDTQIWGADDWDLFIRLAQVGAFVFESRLCLLYRYHAKNASHDFWRMHVNCSRVLHKHVGKWPTPRTWQTWKRGRRFATAYNGLAMLASLQAMDAGNRQRARECLWQAICMKPSLLMHGWILRHLMKCYLPQRTVDGLLKRRENAGL